MKHVHINRQNTAVWSAIFWPLQYQLIFRINHLFTPSRIGLPRLIEIIQSAFYVSIENKANFKHVSGKMYACLFFNCQINFEFLFSLFIANVKVVTHQT